MADFTSPRSQFQSDEKRLKAFADALHTDAVQDGINLTLSQLVGHYELTTEEMAGIRKFLAVFRSMAEKDGKPPVFPNKTLTFPDAAKQIQPKRP